MQLMRSLVSHPAWWVPVSESAAAEMLSTNAASRIQYSRDPSGKNRLLLFSSSDTFQTYREHSGVDTQQHFLTTTGTWVFQLPLDAIDEIWIDPYNPHEIFYDKERFLPLREFAAAIAIEEDLRALRQGTASDGAVLRVRDYPEYLLAIAGHSLMLAPDNQHRALAAVFTAKDCFDAFYPEAQSQAGRDLVLQVPIHGATLFKNLAGMNLTGIVFNCSGPPQPVAFAAQFANVVLEA